MAPSGCRRVAHGGDGMTGMRITSAFGRHGAHDVAGYALDADAPDRTLVVEILIDDLVFATVRADRSLPDLDAVGAGHGFCVTLPDETLEEPSVVEARLANLPVAVGRPIPRQPFVEADEPRRDAGEVEWLGGLRLAGWSGAQDDAPLSVLVDGVLVAHVRPTAWRAGTAGRPVRAFATHLPAAFADGRVHYCALLTERGQELRGSPLAILAFADGLRDAAVGTGVSERDLLRADLFDRLVPPSLPLSAVSSLPADADRREPSGGTRFAILLIGPERAAAESIDSLQAHPRGRWVAASLPAGAGPTAFDPADLRGAIAEAPDCDILVFAMAGTIFRERALPELANAFAAHPAAVAAYADLDVQGRDGTLWSLALPALDYERLLEQGYCSLVFAMRRDVVAQALAQGARGFAALLLSQFEAPGITAPEIVHVPGVLATLPDFDRLAASQTLAASTAAHLGRRGIEATAVAGSPGVLPAVRVRRTSSRELRTSILIPTRNRRDLLDACLASIRPAVLRHQADIIVVDNDSSDPATLAYLTDLRQRGIEVVQVPGPFNFARLINRGAEYARGEALCLLNNDVTALDGDWLDEMLGRLADEDVGAVGPLLTWPSGVVQHGGLVLGPCFEAAPAFTDRLDRDPGYADMLRVARECSAVTAACLLTRRRDFHDLGGLDEIAFPINFNDVDYCLKLREAGLRIVFTPHARLHHPESSSRGRSWSEDRRNLFQRERRLLQLKWGEAIAADPYYNPLLTLGPHPFSGLAAPVRPHAARLNRAPVGRDIPEGVS